MNRPFFSTNNFNITNESFSSTAPANLNGQNFLVNQEQQREIKDSLNASLYGPLNPNFNWNNLSCPGFSVLEFQKFPVPGGVVFSCQQNFPPPSFVCHQEAPDLQNLQVLNELHKCNLQNVQLQEVINRNKFELKFHKDSGTDTGNLTDFPLYSFGTPDFQNICGTTTSSAASSISKTDSLKEKDKICLKESLSDKLSKIRFTSPFRKLSLSPKNQPKKVTSHVFEILDEKNNDNSEKKRVSFQPDVFKDCEKSNTNESCQASLCECCVKKSNRNKRKKSDMDNLSSSSSTSSSKCSLDDCPAKNARKRKTKAKKPNKLKKTDSEYGIIVISDDDDDDKNESNK